MRTIIFCCLVFAFLCCEKNPAGNDYLGGQDEERILFIRGVKGSYTQICTMKPDGSDVKVIKENGSDSGLNDFIISARWSPDKSKIVILGGPESTSDVFALWLMDMKGNYVKKLSDGGYNPIWKNNHEIIYEKGNFYGGNFQVTLINLEEETEQLLSQCDSLHLFFSDINKARNAALGYYRGVECNSNELLLGYYEIEDIKNFMIINSSQVYLPINARLSCNDVKIAFIQGLYRQNDIFVLNRTDSTINNVTNSTANYSNMAWSPNSDELGFSQEIHDGLKDIIIVDTADNTKINITNTAMDSITNTIQDWR